MKRFIIRGLLYSLPLLLLVVLIRVVDPYYLFSDEASFDEDKFKIGYSFDQGRRYKINTYMNNPKDNIILGASEINVINERNIPEPGWHSLSYGGAPLQESLRMYWEIDKYHDIKSVLIAPEFIKFYHAVSTSNGDPYYANFDWQSSQSAKAFDIYNNKPNYFIDKYTIKSTFNYLGKNIFGKKLSGIPSSSKSDFWESQLSYADNTYNHDIVIKSKVDSIAKLFKDIADDIKIKNRNAIIVIPVQHVDLLKYEFQDSIFNYYRDYLHMLIDNFGQIYYFGYTESVSEDSDKFSDPFHYLSEDIYIDGIFKNKGGVILDKSNVDHYLKSIKSILESQDSAEHKEQ